MISQEIQNYVQNAINQAKKNSLYSTKNVSSETHNGIDAPKINAKNIVGTVPVSAGVSQIVAGTNVTVSPGGGTGVVTVNSTGGGSGVSSLTAGTAIGLSGSTGAVTISNTGVTSIVAGSNITISGSTGAVTINSSGGTGIGSSQFFTGTGAGNYTTTSTTLADVDSTNLKGTISGLSVGSKLLVTTLFMYENTSNTGANPHLELNDLTNSINIATYASAYGPSTGQIYYNELIYTAPSTSMQFSLQWNSGGNGSSVLVNNSTNISSPLIQALGGVGQVTIVAPGSLHQAIMIWIQQLT